MTAKPTPAQAAGSEEIRAAYTDRSVAAAYVEARFREPIGAVLHEAQLRAILEAIHVARASRILEVAPGPARLTADVAPAFNGRIVLVDASEAMLAEARKRIPQGGGVARTAFVRGDGFRLPTRGPFDLAYSFRFIRHFEAQDRIRIYREVAAVLPSGSLFLFDAVNASVALALRAGKSAADYPIYDALLDPDTIRRELDAAGFQLVSLTSVQKRYRLLYQIQVLLAPRSRSVALRLMRFLERCPGGAPLEWVVCCRKR